MLGGRLVDRLWIIATWDSLEGKTEVVMEAAKQRITTRPRLRRLHQPPRVPPSYALTSFDSMMLFRSVSHFSESRQHQDQDVALVRLEILGNLSNGTYLLNLLCVLLFLMLGTVCGFHGTMDSWGGWTWKIEVQVPRFFFLG